MTASGQRDGHAQVLTAERAFIRNLRDARERAKVSQERLAKEMQGLGYAWYQQTVLRTENGRRPVRLGEALALCSLLGSGLEILPAPRRVNLETAAVMDTTIALDEASTELRALAGKLRNLVQDGLR